VSTPRIGVNPLLDEFKELAAQMRIEAEDLHALTADPCRRGSPPK
jgi:hypothetical protein